ncbi:spermidine/putrescine ABC transporter ATP-binding protein [Bacillus cereus group sp. TH163-1LC]|nr:MULTISPECIES: spermidine/putrescine ABC transporter ATP-binding protein [unclassified Bacillus cereus group]MDA1645457.1 spermidine/putrescine ABC transporter ATP-binding protein [Bacillus cereus group sp. TH163-1LC]MDA1794261.1 spermidine/putrescine ABC transporter ATP-binding protein [Bacillus cereus group sp. BY8-1LC]
MLFCSFTPLLTGSKTPPQNSAKAKKLVLRSTARKCPIGVG